MFQVSSLIFSCLNQVLSIARSTFTDACLGHHVCHILEGHMQLKSSTEDTRGEGVAMEIPEKPKSRELFEILVEAERTGLPGQVHVPPYGSSPMVC